MRGLAVGDGICAGAGTSPFSPSFVYRFSRLVEETLQKRVYVETIAQHSYDTNDILQLLKTESIKKRVEESELIILSVGQEDFKKAMKEYKETKDIEQFKKTYKKCKRNIDHICTHIQKMRKDIRIIFLYIHHLEEKDRTVVKWVYHLNRHLERKAQDNNFKVISMVEIYKYEENSVIIREHVFPNDKGHEEIAGKLHDYYKHFKSD